jgi:hypothetical protein
MPRTLSKAIKALKLLNKVKSLNMPNLSGKMLLNMLRKITLAYNLKNCGWENIFVRGITR